MAIVSENVASARWGSPAASLGHALRRGVPGAAQSTIIGVVGNDGVWSNIKTFHRMAYPERLVATDLGVRPYHEMVKGLGGYGEFAAEVERARADVGPPDGVWPS